jgi:elongation factor G
MGELHLDIKVDIAARTSRSKANIGAPQVAYRETSPSKVEIDYTHKKQTGGTGQFARVKIVFEPNEPGAGFVRVEDRRRRGAEGIHPRRREGHQVGHGKRAARRLPGVDVKATLIDGAYHDVDSSVLAFEIASRAAFREACRRPAPSCSSRS